VFKGKFPTSNEFETTVTANDKITKGLSVFVTGKCTIEPSSVKSSLEIGADYLHKDFGSVNLKLITPTSFDTDNMKVYGAATGTFNAGSIGFEGQIANSSKGAKLEKWTGYIQHDIKGQSIALFGKNTGKELSTGIGVYRTINDKYNGAFEVSADPQDLSKNNVKVGVNIKLDSNSSLKEKITISDAQNFRKSSVYKQVLWPGAKLTLSSDFNLKKFLPGKDDKGPGNQFGLSLSFFD